MKLLIILRILFFLALLGMAAWQFFTSPEPLLHVSNLLSFGLMALAFSNLAHIAANH